MSSSASQTGAGRMTKSQVSESGVPGTSRSVVVLDPFSPFMVSHSHPTSHILQSPYKFKIRYRHIGCKEVKGTEFYDQCCVPLPKGQPVPEPCIPTACSANTQVSLKVYSLSLFTHAATPTPVALPCFVLFCSSNDRCQHRCQ